MILCDTGPLVAAFNKADDDHERCARFLAQNWTRLVVPSLAVTEICHLLSDPRRRGSSDLASRFCAAIGADELRVIEVTPHDYRRMAELLTSYASLRLQAVDACVIALAERFDVREVAALDHRDFMVVAPRHLPRGQRLVLRVMSGEFVGRSEELALTLAEWFARSGNAAYVNVAALTRSNILHQHPLSSLARTCS